MFRFFLRRFFIIPPALLVANFLGFSYSHLARYFHEIQNPFGSAVESTPPIWQFYQTYIQHLIHLDLGTLTLRGYTDSSLSEVLANGIIASLGLLTVSFLLSLGIGLSIGFLATRNEPAGVLPWLAPLTAGGQAMPGFYAGSLFILAGILYTTHAGPEAQSPLPLQGFGWDLHLVLPALALMIRPSLQIAQFTAGFLSGEMGKQYIVAARSRGNTWRKARWNHALRNVLAPVILAISSSFRLLTSELILVEYLFNWPGIGRLLALALIPPSTATVAGLGRADALFLHPELVAALLTVFTLIFLMADTAATAAARFTDHRLTAHIDEGRHG